MLACKEECLPGPSYRITQPTHSQWIKQGHYYAKQLILFVFRTIKGIIVVFKIHGDISLQQPNYSYLMLKINVFWHTIHYCKLVHDVIFQLYISLEVLITPQNSYYMFSQSQSQMKNVRESHQEVCITKQLIEDFQVPEESWKKSHKQCSCWELLNQHEKQNTPFQINQLKQHAPLSPRWSWWQVNKERWWTDGERNQREWWITES